MNDVQVILYFVSRNKSFYVLAHMASVRGTSYDLLLWNHLTKWIQAWHGWVLFKMSSSIVHCWSIIYQTTHIFTGSYMAISNLTLIHGLIFFPFCRFIPIMQIRHIWIKVHNSSPQKPLYQITPNFTEKVLVWSPLNIVSNIPTLYSTWRPFKKMNLFVYFCLIISQNHLIS
jgi:hypothetical protein